jgi:NADH-quinone oxidoreductase subunit N
MNWGLLSPEIAVTVLALSVLLVEIFRLQIDPRRLGYWIAGVVLLILVWTWCPLSQMPDGGTFTLSDGQVIYQVDSFALFFKRFFLLATVFLLVMSVEFSGQLESAPTEYYSLILFACVGMLLAASVVDFIMLFVSLELITVTFYVLTGYLRRQTASLEAGVKYLVIGAVASAFLLFGITFLFGTTGTTNFAEIATYAKEPDWSYKFGIVLVLVGLGFKIASVPLQVWAPDVYQGAPTTTTAFLAVGSKAAGFALLLRLFSVGLVPNQGIGTTLIAVISALTILYGNLGAIPQRNLKRLLGYSSIGHAGYMLMGIAAGSMLGMSAVLFYLFAYLFTTLTAFMVLVAVSNKVGSDDIEAYKGLAKRSPMLAAAMSISMVSLAGVPPLAGFFGKFLLFGAALESRLYGLIVVALIGVGASLYYYLGVIRVMYFAETKDTTIFKISLPLKACLAITMVAVFFIGIFQSPVVSRVEKAVENARLQLTQK